MPRALKRVKGVWSGWTVGGNLCEHYMPQVAKALDLDCVAYALEQLMKKGLVPVGSLQAKKCGF